MSIVASIRKQITPIHPEGFLFVAGAVVLALAADWLLPRVGWIFWLLPLFVAYFFRDPKRVTRPWRRGCGPSPSGSPAAATWTEQQRVRRRRAPHRCWLAAARPAN